MSVYGTGPYGAIAAFLDREGPQLRYFNSLRRHTFVFYGAGFPTPKLRSLAPGCSTPAPLPSPCPAVLSIRGAGIWNLLSIGYAFCLPLGSPTYPVAESALPGKPLDIRPGGFPTSISLLIPAFSLLKGPRPLSVTLRPP